MNQWLSKFRSRRLKGRFKDGLKKGPEVERSWWNRPSVSLLIGLCLCVSAGILLHTGTVGFTVRPGITLPEAGSGLVLLIITVACALLIRVLAPGLLIKNTQILLLALCSLGAATVGTLLFHADELWPTLARVPTELLIPYAAAPLLAGILLGAPAAVIAGLWTTLLCLLLGNFNVRILLAGLIATVFSALWAKQLRRRTQVIRVGLFIGLLQVSALALSIGSKAPGDPMEIIKPILLCAGSGLMAAMLVLLLLPLCENLFGLTSNMSLLELSDLGHPLLQRLAFEAPGTYHHSLMVANLAQAAADEIGANSILARVGAYFHDIGKVSKPGYFTENIRAEENPHDDLAPSMSALVVMAHIKEGLTLGLLNKLPHPVLDIIQQHHGTGLVYYFHHKAGKQAQAESQASATRRPANTIDESNYRYPGPKPASREAAIIMLADAVEAASRSLEKPTAAGLTELVDRLAEGRIEDGQFDDCEMTLEELSRVKRAFVFCLTNMLHSRIAYPKT